MTQSICMPLEFNKLGISFQYPDNWALDEQDVLAGRKSVTVYSPGGAFWSVSVHPHSADPKALAKSAVDAMREEYTELEVERTEETIAGRQMIGYDMSFYYLDFVSTATIRCIRTDQATYTVFCQAEDRELNRIDPVFRAMTASFLRQLEPAAGRDAWGL